jgi:hypothetical protein
MFTPWNLYVASFVTRTGRITGDRPNPCSRGDFIPLGPTPHAPLNRVHPVKFTPVTAKRISLGYPQGVQPGWNPLGYFTGDLHFFKTFAESSTNTELGELFCLKRQQKSNGDLIH